ncbi:MAG: hypothetical protein Q7S81_03660 [bacterium]|nr:hypothetical protein [bacterium]
MLLALAVLAASCAQAPPAAAPPATTPPAEQPVVTSTEGGLGAVDTQKSTVTVETTQGPQTFLITPNTALTLDGQACTLDQLDALQASSGENFNCVVIYDGLGDVLSVNVSRVPPPASVTGTISDVNIKESTIIVKTAEGDKVYHVDQTTGLLIGGDVISLELLNALLESGYAVPPATIIYATDAEGHAVYVDIPSLQNLTQGTGTVTATDVAKSTVTIMTDKGERTFEVNAATGHFLNNQVCSLDDIQAAIDRQDMASCDVIYYTDKDDNLIYLDATHIAK